MTIQNNLAPNWSFEDFTGTGNTTAFSDFTATRTNGAGTATVEKYTADKRFGATSAHLQTTSNDGTASIVTTGYIAVSATEPFMLRFNHRRLSGADSLSCVVKQYKGTSTDLSDDLTVTPTGEDAWGTSRTVVHAAGVGGIDWHAEVTKVKITYIVTGATASWLLDGICLAPLTSGATSGFGSRLFSNGYPLAELTSIGGATLGRDTIDATNNDSPDQFREFLGGVADGGEIGIEGNLIPSDTNGQVAMEADLVAGTARTFDVILPSAMMEWRLTGNATAFEPSAPFDDKISFSATVKVTGKPTLLDSAY